MVDILKKLLFTELTPEEEDENNAMAGLDDLVEISGHLCELASAISELMLNPVLSGASQMSLARLFHDITRFDEWDAGDIESDLSQYIRED